MSSRKSLSRSTRGHHAPQEPTDPPSIEPTRETSADAPDQPPTASSSKVTLDLSTPPLELHESITWDYEPPERTPVELTTDEKDRLVLEMFRFAPFSVLHDISEHARQQIYPAVNSVEGWAFKMAHGRPDFDREVERGSHALETLLENRVDRAFDMFTAYALRNTFKVPDGLQMVLPQHRGLDFDRARFVVGLKEDELQGRVETLRSSVEQARLVRYRLALAEAVLDKRLEAAEHRRAEVGFVRDAVNDAGLAPMHEKAETVISALTDVHADLEDVKMPPRAPGAAPGIAWETGRQAYLSWAVGKALSGGREGDAPADRLDAIEREAAAVGTEADLEALSKAAAK